MKHWVLLFAVPFISCLNIEEEVLPSLLPSGPPEPITDAPAECIVNTKLSEANRASDFSSGSFVKCDSRDLPTVGKWHQFVGAAGNKIPDSCVPTNHCGTHAPGWLQGEHPKKEDGVVTRNVCFHWRGNCCRWSVMIKVRNCGGYYVYKLEKPPACYLRYCGDKGHIPE